MKLFPNRRLSDGQLIGVFLAAVGQVLLALGLLTLDSWLALLVWLPIVGAGYLAVLLSREANVRSGDDY